MAEGCSAILNHLWIADAFLDIFYPFSVWVGPLKKTLG